MKLIAVVLIIMSFFGGWIYTARTLAEMGPLIRHLMGIPVGFVAMFCTTAIFFFAGVLVIGG